MPFIWHSSKDETVVLERVAASGQGWAEAVTTNGQFEGVFWDEGIVLYSDGSDGDINLPMCKNYGIVHKIEKEQTLLYVNLEKKIKIKT